jgi:hypothetical protein
MPGVLIPDWEPDEKTGRNVPAKITVEDFRRHFSASFPKLMAEEYDDLIQDAIDAVYAMFSGVNTMWDLHPAKVWHDKTTACYRFLLAWFIADNYADLTSNVPSIDGLKQKKVDGVTLTYDTGMIHGKAEGSVQETLAGLRSNHFGRKALMMIQSSAKRAMLRNRRFT